MNILLINHYAGAPRYGMEYRPFYMAREWQRLGHHVTIAGADFSHLRGRQPKAGVEYIEGIRYIWLSTVSYKGNSMRRILNMLLFLFGLFVRCTGVAGRYKLDLVIASSTYPLDIYPAKYIAHRYHAKLLYEVHDLWPLSPMELGGISKYHPYIMAMQLAENYAYRVSNKVVSMLPKAEKHMERHGLQHGKFIYIPNGIDLTSWPQRVPPAEEYGKVFDKMRLQKKFIVLYAGAHGIANALDKLILAGKKLSGCGVEIVLVGKGQEKNKLQSMAAGCSADNTVFLPAVSKNFIPYLLSRADVLYIGLQKRPLFRFGVSPNKMMDYMMAAKPIISAISAGNDPVREAGCGISVPAEDVDAIAGAITAMKNLTESDRRRMGQRGKKFIIKNYDYRILARKILEAV